jgi:PRA1 family protein
MDWNHVTAAEVLSALREVRCVERLDSHTDEQMSELSATLQSSTGVNVKAWVCCQVEWRSPPRPLWEVLQPSRFTVPRSRKKWAARAKNSAYYYRVNYALVLLVGLPSAGQMLSVAVAAVSTSSQGCAGSGGVFTPGNQWCTCRRSARWPRCCGGRRVCWRSQHALLRCCASMTPLQPRSGAWLLHSKGSAGCALPSAEELIVACRRPTVLCLRLQRTAHPQPAKGQRATSAEGQSISGQP